MFIINFCHWLHSNCGPLVLEATTLPTEPHLMARCCQTILVKYWIWSNLFCSFYPQIRNLLQHKRDRDQIKIHFYRFHSLLPEISGHQILAAGKEHKKPLKCLSLMILILRRCPKYWYFNVKIHKCEIFQPFSDVSLSKFKATAKVWLRK